MSSNTIDLEATAAVSVLLEGFDAPPGSLIEMKVRQAYLLGRVDAAAQNFDELVRRFRTGSLEDNLRDSIQLVRMEKR